MPERDIEPDNGKRAWRDPKTGEVHGSGSGIGGQNPGEEIDDGPGGEASLHPLPGDRSSAGGSRLHQR